jgi:hypothetical protein
MGHPKDWEPEPCSRAAIAALASASPDEPRCSTCGETNRAFFCSNGFHAPSQGSASEEQALNVLALEYERQFGLPPGEGLMRAEYDRCAVAAMLVFAEQQRAEARNAALDEAAGVAWQYGARQQGQDDVSAGCRIAADHIEVTILELKVATP